MHNGLYSHVRVTVVDNGIKQFSLTADQLELVPVRRVRRRLSIQLCSLNGNHALTALQHTQTAEYCSKLSLY